jgi:hypothetical protein
VWHHDNWLAHQVAGELSPLRFSGGTPRQWPRCEWPSAPARGVPHDSTDPGVTRSTAAPRYEVRGVDFDQVRGVIRMRCGLPEAGSTPLHGVKQTAWRRAGMECSGFSSG